MSDAVDKPAEVPDEDAPQGFSCPGPYYLPGLVVILNVHLLALSAGMYLTTKHGLSWSAVAITAVTVAGFWVVFLLVASVIGVRGTINLIGFVSGPLVLLGAIIGAVGGLIWLVWWWLSPAS